MTQDGFQIAIRAYLDAFAKHDEQFAQKYKNPAKSIEQCCNYILHQVRKANRVGWDDAEIFGMAIHYYDEADIAQAELTPVTNVRTIINTKLEKPKAEKTATKPQAKKNDTKNAVVTKPVTPAQPKAEKPAKPAQLDLFGDYNPFK